VARPRTELYPLCHLLLTLRRRSDPLKLDELEKLSESTPWALWLPELPLESQDLLKRLALTL